MSFLNGRVGLQRSKNREIRQDAGHDVETCLDLATKIAELQFRNRDYVFVYRGNGGVWWEKMRWCMKRFVLIVLGLAVVGVGVGVWWYGKYTRQQGFFESAERGDVAAVRRAIGIIWGLV